MWMWGFILLCEQTHLAYKVPRQAAATYHIWLIWVHVVLSYHKTSALSLELWEDLRPVSLVFFCRNRICFSSEQFPFGSLSLWRITSFSHSTRGETGLRRGCNGYRGSSIDVDVVDFWRLQVGHRTLQKSDETLKYLRTRRDGLGSHTVIWRGLMEIMELQAWAQKGKINIKASLRKITMYLEASQGIAWEQKQQKMVLRR